MIARITTASSGIVEYLKTGIKNGVDLGRNELDERVCIDGNLALTDSLIKSLVSDKSQGDNYYHITLSFTEKNITQEQIQAVYDDYKNSLMNAYDPSEYNIYSEIHFPKIKYYTDKKTGEQIERLPHVHVVLPKKNLATGNDLKPFGMYKSNVEYLQSIQESINYKHQLTSPFDHQRLESITKADFISRYKGDTFKGKQGKFKEKLFDLIHDSEIRTYDDFKHEIALMGEVSTVHVKGRDVLRIKPFDSHQSIRLSDPCFSKDYIEQRIVNRVKPSEKEINEKLDEWVNFRSYEVKHIHAASPKKRKEFYQLDDKTKGAYLDEERRRFNKQYNIRAKDGYFQSSRWQGNRKLGVKRANQGGASHFTNIMSGLPQQHLDGAGSKPRQVRSAKLLPDNENHNMENIEKSRNNQLRWGGVQRGRGRILKSIAKHARNDDSYLIHLMKNDYPQFESELIEFKHIKQTLDANVLIKELAKTHQIKESDLKCFRTKQDKSYRVRADNRNLNVSDFCTKYMMLTWEQTKEVLRHSYQVQQSRDQLRSVDKAESKEINAILFSSKNLRYKQSTSSSSLKQTIAIFNKLKRQGYKAMTLESLERYRDQNLPSQSDNVIHNASEGVSYKEALEKIQKNKELNEKLQRSFDHLTMRENQDKKRVEFLDTNTGKEVFRDDGKKITFKKFSPDINDIANALSISAEKYGVVKITGRKDFKEKALDIAVSKDLKIAFADKKMQAEFVKRKEELKQSIEKTSKLTGTDKTAPATNAQVKASPKKL